MLFSRIVGARGITFGMMDGVITVLGVLAGLYFLGDRAAVIAGMLIAGLANSLGNAAGIHVSTETEGEQSQEVRMSTFFAFISTAFVTMMIVMPHFFFGLNIAPLISVIVGFAIILFMGFFVGKRQGRSDTRTGKIMLEYVVIAVLVLVASSLIGLLIGLMFGVSYV